MIDNQMTPESQRTNDPTDEPMQSTLTPDELAQLSDPDKQAYFRREYLAQLRQRACPGCGEIDDPLI
ncbi:MAG: hypothetical protein SH868_03005 [Bythopirellula sp.]|nr:hypothetical protein [Bythopirellula sp.]